LAEVMSGIGAALTLTFWRDSLLCLHLSTFYHLVTMQLWTLCMLLLRYVSVRS